MINKNELILIQKSAIHSHKMAEKLLKRIFVSWAFFYKRLTPVDYAQSFRSASKLLDGKSTYFIVCVKLKSSYRFSCQILRYECFDTILIIHINYKLLRLFNTIFIRIIIICTEFFNITFLHTFLNVFTLLSKYLFNSSNKVIHLFQPVHTIINTSL